MSLVYTMGLSLENSRKFRFKMELAAESCFSQKQVGECLRMLPYIYIYLTELMLMLSPRANRLAHLQSLPRPEQNQTIPNANLQNPETILIEHGPKLPCHQRGTRPNNSHSDFGLQTPTTKEGVKHILLGLTGGY